MRKRPFKVTQVHPLLCQSDFLLALNSNLTSIFNRSWDITLSLHLSTIWQTYNTKIKSGCLLWSTVYIKVEKSACVTARLRCGDANRTAAVTAGDQCWHNDSLNVTDIGFHSTYILLPFIFEEISETLPTLFVCKNLLRLCTCSYIVSPVAVHAYWCITSRLIATSLTLQYYYNVM